MNVWRLSKSLGSKSKVPVVNAAVTYTCEYTGESVMLLINNALYFEDMKHNLNPPFMIRLASAEVNECPKCQRKFPRIEDHSIYFPNDDSHEDGYQIPLQLYGTISYLPTTITTKKELIELTQYNLIPDMPEWNPHSDVNGNQEHSMLNYQGQLVSKKEKDQIIFGIEHHSNEVSELSGPGMTISEVLQTTQRR